MLFYFRSQTMSMFLFMLGAIYSNLYRKIYSKIYIYIAFSWNRLHHDDCWYIILFYFIIILYFFKQEAEFDRISKNYSASVQA